MTPCPLHTHASTDHELVSRRLKFEQSPRIQYALKLALQYFEDQMKAHRECQCQVLRRTA